MEWTFREKVKNYFTLQAQRPTSHLVYDFLVIGGFLVCLYVGFIQ